MTGEYQAKPPPLGPAALIAIRLVNAVGKPVGINPFSRAFPNDVTTGLGRRSAVFDQIYRSNFWASAESRSGIGSESAVGAAYRRRLRACLAELGARRFFDAPCGDLNWMLPLARDPAIDYLGADISSELLADTRRRYPDIALMQLDICDDPFPTADIWHCRDCLFHLPFTDIKRALRNFVRSEIPFCLLTSHRARLHQNIDVPAGGFRYLDLERPPIDLPRARQYLKDYRIGRDFPRYVGLWHRQQIVEASNRWDD